MSLRMPTAGGRKCNFAYSGQERITETETAQCKIAGNVMKKQKKEAQAYGYSTGSNKPGKYVQTDV
mgnify:FL=1